MILICIASLLACSAAEFSIVVPDAPVSAFLGSSVVLPCGLSPSLNARTFEVRWYKNGEHEKTVLLYKNQKYMGHGQYGDRVSLIGDLDKGNVSLKMQNLTAADRGEYTCFVETLRWYEKGIMNLTLKALGSTPVLSDHETVEKLNVTCRSFGWFPQPTLTWRDNTGRELPNSHTSYTTDSEGVLNVSSWLIISPSDSEWISCTVGFNLQEMKESRIGPVKGIWMEAFLSTLVLSLIVTITYTVLLVLFRKGLLPHCSSRKNAKAAAGSHESLPAETLPLKSKKQDVTSWQSKYKVNLTLDSSSAPKCLRVTSDRKRVYCRKPVSDGGCKFPHVVSKEELSSGQIYWEVKVWDKTSTKPKSSWSVGVIQKLQTEHMIRALCYEEDTGFYPNTQEFNEISTDCKMMILGVYLNCVMKSLSFFNADKTSNKHLYTFNNIPPGAYLAFFSPGVKDPQPLTIINHPENSDKNMS